MNIDICETGPTVYSPYPRRVESLTRSKGGTSRLVRGLGA